MTREEALRVLQLPSTADPAMVKRAYRRLAREHHPDLGGDPGTFRDLRMALERLAVDAPARPRFERGRPSRPHAGFATAVDVTSIRWDTPLPASRDRLDRDGLAVWLARDHVAPVHPLQATSRAPDSRLNAVATMLAGDLSSALLVGPGTDDRGTALVTMEIHGSCRGARRALDRVGLDGAWLRHRGSNTTVLRSSLPPDPDRPALAVRVTDRVTTLLDALGWPLEQWRVLVDAR